MFAETSIQFKNFLDMNPMILEISHCMSFPPHLVTDLESVIFPRNPGP
jgi:hypothetical protein